MKQNQPLPGNRFAAWVLDRRRDNPGFAAKLRRGDNPDTEYYALGLLCRFGVDIEKENQRLPFALIGAALCRSHSETDGNCGLGEALYHCDKDRNSADEDNPRLRRILACDSVPEICRVLRPVLALLETNGARICLGKLLDDLLLFDKDVSRQRVRLRWAQEYYRCFSNEREDNTVLGDEPCAG
ncbi:MAG: type I-E CRISPR-associated protein Cse2/CasB [Desulfovibrio sp.]|nr:type I-E CRISPR-associated protein Cse2/CasB [Desulfovibrio sp.]